MSVTSYTKQSGAALFVSLILLLVLTIIGLSAANRSTLQERMAANVHARNVAFNAAESAVAGVISDSVTSNQGAASNVLTDLRALGLNIPFTQCFKENGARVDCENAFLDGDRSKAIVSQFTAQVTNECAVCPGGSAAIGMKSVGCRLFVVTGTGTVGNTTENVSFWGYEIQSCN